MARRKRGAAIDGWLLVDKPEGLGSTEAVTRARRTLDARKAGHAGTLDPLATGLLAIAFGEATKTVPLVQDGRKTYRFTARLGQATETDDREGAVIAESAARPANSEISAALADFRGEIRQVPPAFSAVRVGGERAYAIARGGGDVVLADRPLTVYRLELLERPDPDHAVLEMDCGKGGYVRSVARDLGAALGCRAHVSALRRIRSGVFDVAAALPWSALEGLTSADLLPISAALADLPEIRVPSAAAERLRNGQAVPVAQAQLGLADACRAWASLDGTAVAIGTVEQNRFRPARVLCAAPRDRENASPTAGVSPRSES